ncbi:MAG: hypothetical protein ACJ76O_15720 [Gaiellaceae bacterium]
MPLGPGEGGASTSQGRSYGIFQKALQRRHVVAAVAAARELPQLSLLDALELTMLIARKDSSRHPRVAARWLSRFLEEHPDATIEEAGLAASCLIALPGSGYREAAQTLKAMAETANRRRRESGVA